MAASLSITGPLPTPAASATAAKSAAPAAGFGALLDALAGLFGRSLGSATTSSDGGPISVDTLIDRTSDAATSSKLGGIDLGETLATLLPAGVTPPSDGTTAPSPLGTLVDALLALDTGSTASGEDKPLLDRLDTAVDAILALLTPTAAPAIAEPQASTESDAPAAPVTLAAQVVADSRAATGAESAVADAGGTRPAVPAPNGPAQSADAKQLADVVTAAADRIDPQSPLADKLKRLAEGLRSGGLDTAALVRLGVTNADAPGLDRLDKAVTALLSAAPATTTNATDAPARSDFAKVHLDMPSPANPQGNGPDAAAPTEGTAAEPDAASDRSGFAVTRPHNIEARAERTRPSTSPDDAPAPVPDAVKAAADLDGDVPAVSTPARADAPVLPGVHRAALPQPYATPAALVVPQVAVEIARQSMQGASRFQIRLDPAELGRVDVDLDLDASGNTTARLTVDRVETLDLLKRDQPALEKALAQAGLDQSRTTLEFSLRQDSGSSQSQRHPLLPTYAGASDTPDLPPDVTTVTQLYRATARPGGLDLIA